MPTAKINASDLRLVLKHRKHRLTPNRWAALSGIASFGPDCINPTAAAINRNRPVCGPMDRGLIMAVVRRVADRGMTEVHRTFSAGLTALRVECDTLLPL